ncbi:FIVAR domain-containing protein, partial [Finegoldia magna]|uniref:FIVAR domain-containing protein n=1 Tax=Finegoldia magna TaxID=1260 RepID=UPI00399B8087
WSVPEGSDVKVDPDTGVITVPADKVKDGTDVTAKAKDNSGNTSDPTTAKTPGEAVDKAPLQSEVDKNKADAIKGSDKYKNADQDKKDAYDKALANAEKVLADPNATQDDVNKAKKALADAEKALNGEAVDKAPLQSEVDKNKADAIKGSDKYKNADQDKKDAYDKA